MYAFERCGRHARYLFNVSTLSRALLFFRHCDCDSDGGHSRRPVLRSGVCHSEGSMG